MSENIDRKREAALKETGLVTLGGRIPLGFDFERAYGVRGRDRGAGHLSLSSVGPVAPSIAVFARAMQHRPVVLRKWVRLFA